MAQNRGLTLYGFRKKPEDPLVITTGVQRYDELQTFAVSPPLAAAHDHLIEIACAIPPVNPEVLTLKHNAFLFFVSTMAYGRVGP